MLNSPTFAWNQQWALLRRRFTVILLYPVRSLMRLLIWPAVLIFPAIYIVSRLEPGSYNPGSFLVFTPVFVIFATIFSVYSISDTLVVDKATGMKSLLLSMGMGRVNYYCAMCLYSIICILPVPLVTLIVAKIYLLDSSVNYLVILSLSLLFTIQLDALIASSVSLITSSSYTFIIPVLIFLAEPSLETLAREVLKAFGEPWTSTILFIISFSPYEVLRLFFQNYASSHKTPSDSQESFNQPLYLLFLAQITWILVLRLFAYWFEEVCPWQKVSAVRNICFCLSSKKRDPNSGDDSLETSDSAHIRYFEQRSHNTYEPGIRINHLTKYFNKQPAVNDVSFTVYRGETTLLLGHNGAGKSTLMNMILGLLEPDSGFVKLKNQLDRVSSAIGVCPQTSILDEDLTVKQHLELFNDIKSNISGNERIRHIYQTIGDVSLVGHESKRPEELSGGMKRKLSLGIAFVGKSDVLILDEPSSGLDPDSRVFVWDAIRRYRSDRTVLLSTQHMEEADYLGDRIAIMSAGRIVCCGSSVFLNRLFGTGYKLRIECNLSKRSEIVEHIRKHYFDGVHSAEAIIESNKRFQTDPIVDMVLELKTKDQSEDSEVKLIRLLEDLEANSHILSVRSYGLKSSSIEDVMLNTSKYFAPPNSRESAQMLQESTSGHISSLTGVRNRSLISSVDLLRAMVIKHVQVYMANWFSVLFLKTVLPCMGTFLVIQSVKRSFGKMEFFQNPALALIVGHLIYYPTRERASKFKIMQSTSQSSISLYWTSQLIFDFVWILVPLISINIFAATLIAKPLVGAWTLHGMITLAVFLFYIASMFQCYCLSNIITNARSSIGYLFILSASSSALGFVVNIMRLAIKMESEWIQWLINYVGILALPSDALSFFFVGLPAECYIYPAWAPFDCQVQKDVTSPIMIGFIALCIQIVAYSSLLIFIELQYVDLEYYFRLRNMCPCFNNRKEVRMGENREIDRDVVEETAKALTGIKDVNNPHALVAAQLNKSYIKDNKIVENLSFTVNKGECFGLLGVNGAGKTTTFSMLATETAPDSGDILINGYYTKRNLNECRKKLGYDPQATPEMSLTPYQALALMARLRGVDYMSIPMVVNAVLEVLEMTQHTNKCDNELSGGTKRKLALGMALIGNPAVLALDEPTAGVDPLARRSIWQLLKSLRTHNDSSIIISSHAMEECEAICDRITIMAKGRLRCIGTFLHLRSKFAKGCTLRVQFTRSSSGEAPKRINSNHHEYNPSNASQVSTSQQYSQANTSQGQRRSSGSSLSSTDKIVEELYQQLVATIGPSVFALTDRNVNSVTFRINDNRVRRSILFKMMRAFRLKHSNVSYMINDSSLEDIFISLAREQQEMASTGQAPQLNISTV